MGREEATKVVGKQHPLDILGLTGKPTWDEIKSVYRKLVLKHHPDRGGDPEMFKKVQAAYELLEEQYEQSCRS
jgi:DnaJ family protein A protein 2